ncbi:transposase [Nonomuraea fuscirosea]|uniref:transposase n=1 Tax=Nonomuraea fuscirosea TaxID=1291556 RepID=UPI00343CB93C
MKTSTNVPLTSQGTDAAKKIAGRKRGIVTHTLGIILAVAVAAAGLSDNVIGKGLLDQTRSAYPTISKTWVDTGFKNALIEHGRHVRHRRRSRLRKSRNPRIPRRQTPLGRRKPLGLAHAALPVNPRL